MFVVDASPWVGRFVSTDKIHRQSYDWLLDRLNNLDVLVMPILALAEIGGAVARRNRSEVNGIDAVEMVRILPNVELVDLDPQLGLASAAVAARLGLKGADAVYVAVASQYGLPLVTWDDEQLRRGANVVRTATPAELLTGRSG